VANANVQIPAGVFESLATVLELSDEEFVGLLSALDDPDASSKVEAGELVESFVALNRLRKAHGWTRARAADRIASSDAAPVTSEEEVERLRSRVLALLETPSVAGE
jgi:hypothetical protein